MSYVVFNISTYCIEMLLGAVHKLRNQNRGWGVAEMQKGTSGTSATRVKNSELV